MTDKLDFLHESIKEALKRGARYADIFIQSGEGHSVHFEDGKIDGISSSTSDGAGSRVIVDDRTFYAHAPGNDEAAVSASFAECAASAGMDGLRESSSSAMLMERGEPIAPPRWTFSAK